MHIIHKILLVICLAPCLTASAQDSLTVEVLEKFSYPFTIEDGKLKGRGAAFLSSEINKSQFTMLGEYHGSKKISELTQALIPILDGAGYETMALEVGPISAEVLNELSAKPAQTVANINSFNQRYQFIEDEEDVYTAIPFFEHVEDALFLQSASERNWAIFGIDQEFTFSYDMLADRMYDRLSKKDQRRYKELYEHVQDSIQAYYRMDETGERRFSVSATHSPLIRNFLTEMRSNPNNQPIADAFDKSVAIYKLNADRQWYANNATRIHYMKEQLRKGLAKTNFNLSKDKLFIKMGGVHLSKGHSPLSLYEVGNTLNELAEFNGNKALNMSFMTRYYETEDGSIADELDNPKAYSARFHALRQIGKADEWTVLDMRQLKQGIFYYPLKHLVNKWVEDIIIRYDLLIIPPTETTATPNY